MKNFQATCLFILLSFLLIPGLRSQTWVAQSSGTTQNLFDIYFPTPTTGWIVGGPNIVRKSINGGANWSAQTAPSAWYYNSTFLSDTYGWISGTGGVVAKTTNGGSTWSQLTTGTSSDIYGLKVVNANVAYLNGNGFVRKTTDGGTSWTLVTPSGLGGSTFHSGLEFVDENTGWTVGSSGRIFKTTDGGTSWVQQVSPISNWLRDVKFYTPLFGIIVGDGGAILKTLNGGTSWVQKTSNTTEPLYDAFFLDTDTIWVVGGTGTILLSSDAGETWTVQTSPTTQNLHGVHFADSSNGWIGGHMGTVLKYVPPLNLPPCTSLTNPTNGAINVPVTTDLSWGAATGATGYKLTVGTTSGGTDILDNFDVGNVVTYDPPGDFPYNTTIYVKITPYNLDGDAVGCTEESFTTLDNTCLMGGITFSTQAEVDAFSINYPNCTEILGDVFISGSDIANLNGLAQVTNIGEALEIGPNPMLTSLAGLANLTSIEAYLYIYDNPGLTNLSGLNALTSVGEDVTIENNDGLLNLSGLSGLTAIPLSLDVNENDALVSLNGLGNIVSVGGGLTISSNAALADISDLGNLASIADWLDISGNPLLPDLDGLDNLTDFNGWLSINSNNSLANISSLSGLTYMDGEIDITDNMALTSLSGLENIDHATITDLYIQNSINLSTCEVQSICDYLAIPSNPATISGNATGCATRIEVETICNSLLTCTNLTNPANGAVNVPVTSALTWAAATGATGYKLTVGTTSGGTDILDNFDVGNVVTYNPAGNFPANTTIYVTVVPYNAGGDAVGCMEESFTTGDNTCLSSGITFSTQAQIDAYATNYPGCTEILGNVTIQGNNITNLNGLSQITLIDGNLLIQQNPNLSNLNGLQNLLFVNEFLGIYVNNTLDDISALSNITTLPLGLGVGVNPQLTSLDGLNNLTNIGSTVLITENDNLNDITALSNVTSINGYLRIISNGSLQNLNGLQGLTTVTSQMEILGNGQLQTLVGLDNLTSIGRWLRIEDNAALNSLAALSNLNTINANNTSGAGYLYVINNGSLLSLSGLDNLDETKITNLKIESSVNLSTCDVASICSYLAVPSNPATISGNATGCADRTEVWVECGFSPPCTVLTSPLDGATGVPVTTSLTWDTAFSATGYKLTVGTTPGGTDILDYFDVGNVTTYNPAGDFPNGATIYVSITPYNSNGDAAGCTEESFTTIASTPFCESITNDTLTLYSCNGTMVNTNIGKSLQYESGALFEDFIYSGTPLHVIAIEYERGGMVFTKKNNVSTGTYEISNVSLTKTAPNVLVWVGEIEPGFLLTRTYTISLTSNELEISNELCNNSTYVYSNIYLLDKVDFDNIDGCGTYSFYMDVVPGAKISLISTCDPHYDIVFQSGNPANSVAATMSFGQTSPSFVYNNPGDANGALSDLSADLVHNIGMLGIGVCQTVTNTSVSDPEILFCTNLTVPLGGETGVAVTSALTWAASTGATGYKLTVGTTSGGTDILDNFDAGNVLTYDPPGDFPYNTTIYVKITPYNANGDAAGCTEESFTTEAAPLPAPTLLPLTATTVIIKYHAPIDPATTTAANLKIWGDETGLRSGTYSVSADTVTFQPTTPFRAGELLHITSKSSLLFTGGGATQPFSWVRQSPVTHLTVADFDTTGTGIILPAAAYGANASYQSTMSDVNRDGLQDVVFRYHASYGAATNVLVYLRNANGTFATPVTYTNAESHSGLIGTPDLNNDGYPDIVIFHNVPSRIQVRLNNGSGGFGAATLYTVSNYCNGANVYDLDQDGDLDIVAYSGNSNPSQNAINVLKNNGNGTFAAATTLPTGVASTAALPADLDGDGVFELLYSSNDYITGTPVFRVYTNDGNANFTQHSSEANSSNKVVITAFDYDGNGSPDIITRNPNTEIHLGNSGLTYTLNSPTVLSAEQGWPLSGDLDGDGDLDVFIANSYNGTNWNTLPLKVLINDGTGTFTITTTALVLPSIWTSDLSDYDGDGDLDHIYLNPTTGEIRVLLNGNDLACTNLTDPANAATNVPVTSALTWAAATGATGYKLTVGTTPGGTDILDNLDVGNVTTYDPAGNFPYNTTIYVKITPYNASGDAVGCVEEFFYTADQCPPGDVILLTQAEVDAFVLAYPDCSQINGSLQIGQFGPYSDINSIAGLSSLTSIMDDLRITLNPNLASCDGFENLQSIGKDLTIVANSSLTDLSAFSNLTSPIPGYLNINYNASLVSLTGLENITSIAYGLSVEGNNSLPSLLQLTGLTSIGGLLYIADNPLLSNCEAQAICDYLPSPPGTVTIQNNAAGCDSQAEVQSACAPSCTNLTDPTNGTTSVPVTAALTWAASSGATGYKLNVGTTPGGTDILDNFDVGNVVTHDPPGDFPTGTAIYVKITPYNASGDAVGCSEESFTTVFGCPVGNVTLLSQADVNAFVAMYAGCTQISGNLRIGQYGVNSDIINIAGLSSLTTITGHLDVSWSPGLTSLGGLSNITTVGSFLQIDNIDGINNLLYFANLDTVGGSLYIIGNSGITNLLGFEGLNGIPETLILNSNPNLTSCDGLDNLQGVGSLTIIGNSNLTDLTALSNLTSTIAGYLNINYNASLTNLAGLDNITAIGYGLSVEGNNSLSSLLSLTGLDTIGGSLTIMNNPALASCDALAICNYLAAPPGSISISNNATGCNNQTEVETACALPPSCTSLTMPLNAAANVPINSSLSWATFANATGYKLTIGTAPGGTDILDNFNVGNVTTYDPAGDFPYGTTIYVKITPYNANGDATGCTEESFTTEGCLPNLVIATIPIPDGTYMSLGDLTAHDAIVANLSTVIFTSDTGILLEHDFEVELGAVFDAYIQGCPTNLMPPFEEK
ncbi:MAG: FG-GAP-like repeat-containing protein [Saprospiraceae bacterium]